MKFIVPRVIERKWKSVDAALELIEVALRPYRDDNLPPSGEVSLSLEDFHVVRKGVEAFGNRTVAGIWNGLWNGMSVGHWVLIPVSIYLLRRIYSDLQSYLQELEHWFIEVIDNEYEYPDMGGDSHD